MQVVQNDKDRLACGQPDEEARDTVQQPQPLFIRLQLLVLVHPVIETRYQPREHADGAACRPAQFVGLLPRRPRADRLGERVIGRQPPALEAAAPQHQGAAGPHGIGERAQERGLADAGLPDYRHHPAMARRGRLVTPEQPAQLLTVAKERSGRCRCRRRRRRRRRPIVHGSLACNKLEGGVLAQHAIPQLLKR